MAAARVPLQARADPGGRLPDDPRRRTGGACIARPPNGWRRDAGRGGRGGPGRPRPPLAGRRRRGQGHRVPDQGRRPGPSGVRAGRGHRALPGAAPAARGAGRARSGRRWSCSSWPSPCTPRCGSPRRTRPTSGPSASGGRPPPCVGTPSATLRVATSFLPNDPDPKSAIAWPNIQLCMQLFDRLVEQWPERTIVPSLAERWEISDDGLRYAFQLREGLRWSDGDAADRPRRRVRHQARARPGQPRAPRWRSTSCSRTGRTTTCGVTTDPDRIGVRALDDRTVEFRLAAPAPYFMSVMNRPDGGPQPRHAIETPRRRRGPTPAARW